MPLLQNHTNSRHFQARTVLINNPFDDTPYFGLRNSYNDRLKKIREAPVQQLPTILYHEVDATSITSFPLTRRWGTEHVCRRYVEKLMASDESRVKAEQQHKVTVSPSPPQVQTKETAAA